MEASLVVVGGKASKAKVALKLPAVIGRSRQATLTVAHPMVSRKHCEVFEADGLLMVRDLGSLNGTVIGGRRIKQSPLPPDAQFVVGPLTFRAEYKYDGDLGQLPAPVWAEGNGAANAPDIEVVDDAAAKDETEEQPSPPPETRRPSAKPAPATKEVLATKSSAAKAKRAKPAATASEPKAQPKVSVDESELPDDLFNDLLGGLD